MGFGNLCPVEWLIIRRSALSRRVVTKSDATDDEELCNLPGKIITAGDLAGQRLKSLAAGMIDRSE